MPFTQPPLPCAIDYRNDRVKYVEGFWKVVNWEFAATCLAAAKK